MTRLFVTASGTDIGKTFLMCQLIELLNGHKSLRVLKPVASGVDLDELAETDTAQLLKAQGITPDAATFIAATPWHFRAPLSPDMAAAREGKAIPFDELIEHSMAGSEGALTLIEGIGGALVPLTEDKTVLDWIEAVSPTLWLVGGTYLGSLSHTLATLDAIRSRKLVVDTIVVSESEHGAAALNEIVDVVQRFAGPTRVLPLGRPPTAAQLAALARALPA